MRSSMTLPRCEVDRPAVERRRAFVRAEAVAVEHLRVADDVEHDAVAVVVGVQRVEHVAGLDVEPPDVVGRGLPRQDADASGVVRVPPVGEARAGHGSVEVEGHRQVVDHDVVLGEREVVHHRAGADLDVDGAAHPAVGADHRVLHDVAPAPEVRERVQLAGLRVALGVGGVAAGQRAVEVARPDRVELVGELVRAGAGLDDGEGAAGVADHVGVAGEVHVRRAPARAAPARRGPRRLAADAPTGCGTTRPCRRGGARRGPCRRR